MSKKLGKSARKRLLDEFEQSDSSRQGQPKVAKGQSLSNPKGENQNKKFFSLIEKPFTRSKGRNQQQMSKNNEKLKGKNETQATDENKANTTKRGNIVREKTGLKVNKSSAGTKSTEPWTRTVKDKSNNNATVTVNSDPSKFVLTKWEDVTVLGERKLVETEKVDDNDREETGLYDDGITVTVDTDEFDFEEDDQDLVIMGSQNEINNSSDEEVKLGESAVDNRGIASTSTGGATAQGSGNLQQIQNIDFEAIMSRLLDQKLQKILPQNMKGANRDEGNLSASMAGAHNKINKGTNIKSPSDTTIYAPALKKQNELTGVEALTNPMLGLNMTCNGQGLVGQQIGMSSHDNTTNSFNDIEKRVSAFVGEIRHETENGQDTLQADMHARRGSMVKEAEMLTTAQDVRERANAAILEAEKFNATVASPAQGNLMQFVDSQNISEKDNGFIVPNEQNIGNNHFVSGVAPPNIGTGFSDDDFFHLTCHIEPGLIHKIENGEFVELEKLLPRDRNSFTRGGGAENRLEWVQREGGTFLVPAGNREHKITGIRKWEQAFRAYATIYCAAHPQRSKEVWQYISVINTAASAYVWDNVYNYDITFRHLMAFNPNRSWAVTYNQMWNLSMRDPLPKNNNFSRSSFQFHSNNNGNGGGHAASGKKHGGSKRKKADYCWNFNKGIKCKYGARCRFVERCSFCDSPTHGIHVCDKLKEKDRERMVEGLGKVPESGSN